jgi:hypothetical protein
VTLTPGDVYTVVDQLNSNGWGYGSVTNDEAIFNYNDYGYNATSPTAYSLNGSGPAYLGGNVMYLTPEPDTLLLLGSGLLGLAGFARSKFGKKTS